MWVKRTDSTGDNRVYFKRANGTTVWFYVNNSTVAPVSSAATLDSTGFTVPDDTSGATYVAWVFKKAANFLDIVDYTGTGANTTVAHALAEVPGMIVVGRYSGTSSKVTCHPDIGASLRGVLNNNGGFATDATYWNSTAPTSSVFSVGTNTNTNANTIGYFAFLFGSNSSTVKCGAYAGSASAIDFGIGFQPRYVLVRQRSTGDWIVGDTARTPGFSGADVVLRLNTTAASGGTTDYLSYITGGFRLQPALSFNSAGEDYVYMAVK